MLVPGIMVKRFSYSNTWHSYPEEWSSSNISSNETLLPSILKTLSQSFRSMFILHNG